MWTAATEARCSSSASLDSPGRSGLRARGHLLHQRRPSRRALRRSSRRGSEKGIWPPSRPATTSCSEQIGSTPATRARGESVPRNSLIGPATLTYWPPTACRVASSPRGRAFTPVVPVGVTRRLTPRQDEVASGHHLQAPLNSSSLEATLSAFIPKGALDDQEEDRVVVAACAAVFALVFAFGSPTSTSQANRHLLRHGRPTDRADASSARVTGRPSRRWWRTGTPAAASKAGELSWTSSTTHRIRRRPSNVRRV